MNNKKFILLLTILNSVNLTFAATLTTPPKSRSLSEIIAKPIPPTYHLPTPTSTIEKWIATSDAAAMRAHGWELWAGINADSGEIYQGKELPIWETWYGVIEVFSSPKAIISTTSAMAFLASHRGSLHAFVEPHQFTHMKRGLSIRQALGSEQSRIMSFNKFSPDAATFITSPHIGPDGQTYYYNSGTSLRKLNSSFPANTSGEDRRLARFPVSALVLKPAFSIVKAEGLTPLPLWQGVAGSTQTENPTPNTWKTCVLIDPKGEGNQIRPAKEEEIAKAHPAVGLSCKTYLYAPLSSLYWFRLSASEAAVFNKTRKGGVDPNDFAVLVALHVSTREIPFWTWQTFYWQPGADTPDKFPGSKEGQPKNLKAPWNNYAMCVNYSQTTTPGGKRMVVCINPYIETMPGLPAGMSSNCMSCHSVARISTDQESAFYPEDYKEPIALFTDPIYFNSSSTHTEFSWAIASAPDDDGRK